MKEQDASIGKTCRTIEDFHRKYLPKSYEDKLAHEGDPEKYGSLLAMQSIKSIQRILSKASHSR
jgi:hypothetical protein